MISTRGLTSTVSRVLEQIDIFFNMIQIAGISTITTLTPSVGFLLNYVAIYLLWNYTVVAIIPKTWLKKCLIGGIVSLLTIFIIDFEPAIKHSRILIFADDTKIYMKITFDHDHDGDLRLGCFCGVLTAALNLLCSNALNNLFPSARLSDYLTPSEQALDFHIISLEANPMVIHRGSKIL